MLRDMEGQIKERNKNIHTLSPSPHLKRINSPKNSVSYKKFFGKYWSSPNKMENSPAKTNSKLNETPKFIFE